MSGSTFGEPVAGGQALEAQGLRSRGSGVGEQFEVRKYGHSVPVASGTCENCGRPVRYNLAAPIVIHVGGGEPNDCRDPWPAVSIERPEIDGEASEGYGASTATNEGRSGGSDQMAADSGATLREWDVTVTMVRTVDGRKETRDFTVRVPAAGTSGAETAAHGIGYAINEGSGHAWKFASAAAIRVQRVDGCVSGRRADGAPLPPMCCGGWVNSNGGAATLCEPCPPTPLPPIRVQPAPDRATAPDDGLVKVGQWPTIADAGTAEFDRLWAELENGPEPVVELDQEIDCCARATGRHTRGGPDHCGLCGKPFDVPLPPVGDETREHPADQPTSNREFIAAEVERLGLQAKADAMWAEIENGPPMPPGWCTWHQMVDCAGFAPECHEARAEIAGDGDRCDDVYTGDVRGIGHTCGRPSGHPGSHYCRCAGLGNYTWTAEANRG